MPVSKDFENKQVMEKLGKDIAYRLGLQLNKSRPDRDNWVFEMSAGKRIRIALHLLKDGKFMLEFDVDRGIKDDIEYVIKSNIKEVYRMFEKVRFEMVSRR